MSAATPDFDFIESMAREQVRYENIFAEHAAVLQTDMPRFAEAWARVAASPLVATPGQQQVQLPPADRPDEVDAYLARCEEMCRMEARDFEDRAKIMHAAHGALLCLAQRRIAQHPEKVQLAILKRRNELQQAMLPSASRASAPSPPPEEAPLAKSSATPRPLTAEERELFQSPSKLHGKQFILSPEDDDEASTYEVISYSLKRDKTAEYDVLFADCPDPIRVDAEEMVGMLADSLYLPAAGTAEGGSATAR